MCRPPSPRAGAYVGAHFLASPNPVDNVMRVDGRGYPRTVSLAVRGPNLFNARRAANFMHVCFGLSAGRCRMTAI